MHLMTNKQKSLPTKDIIQSYFKAIAQGDIDKALSLLTEDVVWHVDGDANIFSIGLASGKQQIANWMRAFPKQLNPIAVNINNTLIDGNEAIVLGDFRYSVNKTGHFISSDMAIHFTLRDGKIARYHIFEDSLLLSRSFNFTNDFTKKEIKLNGTRYAYSDRGNGPTLIFMHGLFADRAIFESLVTQLEKNYRCITFDLPGHGHSDYPKQGWTLEDLAQDIALFISELKLSPVTLIGQSQGGMIAILLATLHSSLVANLIVIGTSARKEYSERLPRWQETKHIIAKGSFDEKEQLFIRIQSLANSSEWINSNTEQAANERRLMHTYNEVGLCLAIDAATIKRQDIRSYLPEIRVPTLVICGDKDQATPIEVNKEISDNVANGRLIVLEGVAHHPPTEAPDEVLKHIKLFLQ